MSEPRKTLKPRGADGNRPSPAARDAGLEKLRQLNRWLVAGAVGLTIVLSAVVAQASSSGHSSAAAAQTSAPTSAAAASSGGAGASSASAIQPAVAPSAVVTSAS
jgi:hypothetical protein